VHRPIQCNYWGRMLRNSQVLRICPPILCYSCMYHMYSYRSIRCTGSFELKLLEYFVCLQVFLFVCLHECTFMHAYMNIFMFGCMYILAYAYIHMFVCVFVCVCVCVCLCVCVCVCVCARAC